jgi:hypothetical protein
MKANDLAARLSEHSVAVISATGDMIDGICCASPECVDEGDLAIEFPDMEAFAVHQADVALAWFQEHTTEEWGVKHYGYGNAYHVEEADSQADSQRKAEMSAWSGYAEPSPVRRRVTAWEEAKP